jgi:hypothetical protein
MAGGEGRAAPPLRAGRGRSGGPHTPPHPPTHPPTHPPPSPFSALTHPINLSFQPGTPPTLFLLLATWRARHTRPHTAPSATRGRVRVGVCARHATHHQNEFKNKMTRPRVPTCREWSKKQVCGIGGLPSLDIALRSDLLVLRVRRVSRHHWVARFGIQALGPPRTHAPVRVEVVL